MTDQTAEHDLCLPPALPVRRRRTCTRDQLTDALEHAQDHVAVTGHIATVLKQAVAETTADAILSQLPSLGDDLVAVSRDDLRAVLAGAHSYIDAATFNRCAEAAGLVTS